MPRTSTPSPPPQFTPIDPLHSVPSTHHEHEEPAPRYDLTVSQAFRQWKTADEASAKLFELQPALHDLQNRLQVSHKELRVLKDTSAALFGMIHSRPSKSKLSFIPGKKKKEERNHEQTDALQASFDMAHQAEMKKSQEVEQMELQASDLLKNIEEFTSTAAVLDEAWTQLHRTINATPRTQLDREAIGTAEDAVMNGEAEFDIVTRTIADMTRARQTIQHAHHYFQNALRIYDAIRGPANKSVGSFGEMGRMHDYRASATLSEKAQVCLDEYFRVMESYVGTLPDERLADHDALKGSGLQQMLQIYKLLFGGHVMTTGTRESVLLMVEMQDKAFVHLTALAVWVQNRLPVVEEAKKGAEIRRNEQRRRLANLWLQSHRRRESLLSLPDGISLRSTI
ncbi:hypothetical protein BD410DRAFT_894160 [Rickenella mellea]|uniref:Uncharacterized protein n=1 Tax=Rickenella mellea TaxID=50990 RepID=A0A4Y7QMH1_9AGAM|nr:hypothetical protein BD410DRAFT_894160 [Rickenella mellea]